MSASRKKARRSNNATRNRPYAAPGNGRDVVEEDLVDGVEESVEEPLGAIATPPKRRLSMRRKILFGVLITLLLAVGGGALWAYTTVQRTLPTLTGTVRFPGLSAPVTVTRDLYGVPHIVAANAEDLYAAQGYVHAQDRLFQMFFFRVQGQGRLAELLSPTFVDSDRVIRTLGFHRAAEAELPTLPPDVRANLDAYARGVNEFVRTHQDSLPLEFVLSGAKFEEWQPVDTLAFGKLQAWDLTDTWDDDLVMSDLIAKVGQERATQLVPPYPADGPTIVSMVGQSKPENATLRGKPASSAPAAEFLPLVQFYREKTRLALPGTGLGDVGSNNWALSGDKTTTGKPLLANDPHLNVRNPSPWYQVHLSTSDGEIDVAGFGFAGAPGIVTGHNRDIAWGVTNTGADVQDVFIEKLDPAGHPGQYLSEGGNWQPLKMLTETIEVKGGVPVTHVVRFTHHGPILSDPFLQATVVSPTMPFGETITDVISLQWTAHPPGRIIEAVFDLQTASNWQEFRAALEKWDVPGQNFVYADREGNIGYQMTGKLPVRKGGDGLAAIPGWTGEGEWTGTLPFGQMPTAYNPPEGYVASANNKPFSDPNLKILGYWSAPWRIKRIQELLNAKEKFSVEDMEAMLKDTVSPLSKKWLPVLSGLKPAGEREKALVQMLSGWDGDLKAESAPAAVYEFVARQALTQTFADDLGDNLFASYVRRGNSPMRALELLLDKPDDPLWDRVDTTQRERRDDTLGLALTAALGDLDAVMGDNMADWQWGKAHVVVPSHPFGGQPLIGGLFNLSPHPLGGDISTVSVAGFPLYGGFVTSLHQSYRMIVDTEDWNNSRAIYATGQSGQPFAKHWGDMYDKWRAYEYNPLLYAPERIREEEGAVLVLQP